MIQLNDITDAVKAAILSHYPTETVYTELAPKGFARPSFLVECMDATAERLTCAIIQMTAKVKVTCFVDADVRGYSHFAALSVRQMAVMGILLRGCLKLADGQILAISSPVASSGGYDFAEITTDVQWQEDYAQFDQIELPPVMADLQLDLSVNNREE